jgi:hypothetical protein
VLKVTKKNDTVQEKAAWTPGDAVRVIGSHKVTTLPAAKDTANSGTEEGYWQYTPKVCDSSIYFRISLRNSSHSHRILYYRPYFFKGCSTSCYVSDQIPPTFYCVDQISE